jgi:hypothetical protein
VQPDLPSCLLFSCYIAVRLAVQVVVFLLLLLVLLLLTRLNHQTKQTPHLLLTISTTTSSGTSTPWSMKSLAFLPAGHYNTW